MKAAGRPSRWKADVGKLFAYTINANTLSRLIGVMCLFLLVTLSCNPEKNQPAKSEEKAFIKIDFAWIYNHGSYGGIIIDSNGLSQVYTNFKDSAYVHKTLFPDSILNQIKSLIPALPDNYTCPYCLDNDTTSSLCIDAAYAEIYIYTPNGQKKSRCYITEYSDRINISGKQPQLSILNFFYSLHHQYPMIPSQDGSLPQSPLIDTLKSKLPPIGPPIRFEDLEDGA
ncbi:MAG: hypothetical protein IM638_15100 [Bacteroidetes bacterium]|nr:hypothetical protein [Bacteroidota bacterium]